MLQSGARSHRISSDLARAKSQSESVPENIWSESEGQKEARGSKEGTERRQRNPPPKQSAGERREQFRAAAVSQRDG